MALRDDLKNEVAEIQAKEEQDSAQRRADIAFFREHLQPAMLRAHSYFAEVVSNLQIISPKVFPKYPLNPLVEKGVSLRQIDYKFRSDDGKKPREIDVLSQAVLDRPVTFYLDTRERAEKHANLLDSYDFAYHQKNYLDKHYNIKGATFFLEGPMHIRFRIRASLADRCIYVDLRNLSQLKRKRYKFSGDELDESLFDRLTQVLLRKEEYLFPPNIGEVERDQLQKQLDIEQRLKDQDMTAAWQQQEARKQAEKEALLINRTKRTIVTGSKDALGLVKQKLEKVQSSWTSKSRAASDKTQQ